LTSSAGTWSARPRRGATTATIYQALGIPRSAVWRDTGARPHSFYTGQPIEALFA
jgi:hypothetical protein